MHKNDEVVAPMNFEIVVSGNGIDRLTEDEERLIQRVRIMAPAVRKIMFDLAAENVRCSPRKLAALKLVGPAK